MYLRKNFISKGLARMSTRKPVCSIWSYTLMYAGHTIYEATYVTYVIILNITNEEIFAPK